jgi:hypothetical protein
MVGLLETPQRLTEASGTLDHREIRIRFESRAALLDGFALAQRESWIEDCYVVPPRLELVIRMAGGFSIDPGQGTAPRQDRRAALSIAGQPA